MTQVTDSLESIIIDPKSERDYTESGVLGFSVIPPDGTEQVILISQYSDMNGQNSETKQVLFKSPSDFNKYLSLWTSTEEAVVDEYAVFHVKSNFWTPSFQYLVSESFVI